MDLTPPLTMFFSGAAAGALFAFGPVYAAEIGMSNAQISLFLSSALIGSMFFQLPIGALSDRYSRRGIMAICASVATGASVIGLSTGTGFGAMVVMFAIGATSFPLYSLAIAYTNDWISSEQRVGASGLLVMINGVGAIIGPLAASMLMLILLAGSMLRSAGSLLMLILLAGSLLMIANTLLLPKSRLMVLRHITL